MTKKIPQIKLRIPKAIHDFMLNDLCRPHAYAHERVGFISTTSKRTDSNTIIIMVTSYNPVRDESYIEDRSVGARINSVAIREEMQRIFDNSSGSFHVHLHSHNGTPTPSFTDRKEIPGIIESFSNVGDGPHGILILSQDSFYGIVKCNGIDQFIIPEVISVVGYPMKFVYPKKRITKASKLYDRQSFLGEHSQFYFENVRVGIIGYGGGGSHIGQQLAHIGIKKITVFDDDIVEDTNMNRLVGAQYSDIKKQTFKINVAKRLIKKILPKAEIECIKDRWQNQPDKLQECDLVIGGLDSYMERRDLESECRRNLIPLVDIGMDIHSVNNIAPIMSGQIILSMPGMPCMHCFGFLTEEKLKQEAGKYGDVGGRPQVIWANGTLASSAIGVCIDLITGWTNQENRLVYLSYNGNQQSITNHIRLEYAPKECCHYKLDQTGPPKFKPL